MRSAPPVFEAAGVQKAYSALRPLRMRSLTVAAAERVGVIGIDAPATELLVNLITGATLPDQGDIRVQGKSTAAIATGDEWLSSLDRFGIVSSRAVLLEGATLAQNLAMPFTLDIDPLPEDVRARVETLAAECGIAREWLGQPAGELPPEIRVRAHLARGVALDPVLLIVEHPTASVPQGDHKPLANDIARVADARRLATIIVTMDRAFAAMAAHRSVMLNPATGEMAPVRRGWFS